ncbi:uncharacterized protein LOC141695972 [Apium graveolens]|uniref:uncharacterized protein LOC141660267 n=1 Tax=Apium graveolens TaxID=4045 RepID=UPI003D7B70C0
MANRSIKYPLGILEDVPVRVGKFYIPVDFVVLDMEEDSQIRIILDMPFLCTTGAVIDVKNGTLTLSVGDDKITFTLTSALKSHLLENTYFMIDVIDEIVHDEVPQILLNDALEAVLMLEASEGEGHSEVDSLILELDGKADPSQSCEKLPPPVNVKGVRSFLGHAEFYLHFIKEFSKISKPLTQLLLKDATFEFTDACLESFYRIKNALITAPIIQPPDWNLPFKIICDASDYAVGAVLGRRIDKVLHVIYYASKTLDEAQVNCATTEKELLAVVYAFDKFRTYLIGSKMINYLHLLLELHGMQIFQTFMLVDLIPPELTYQQRKRFYHDAKQYFWDDPFLYRKCADGIFRKCVSEFEVNDILRHCHSLACRGHHSPFKTAAKVLQYGFFWPSLFKDARAFFLAYDACQRTGNISKRHEMPQTGILGVEIFDVWGIDFMGPFPTSCGMKYILVAVDDVSK